MNELCKEMMGGLVENEEDFPIEDLEAYGLHFHSPLKTKYNVNDYESETPPPRNHHEPLPSMERISTLVSREKEDVKMMMMQVACQHENFANHPLDQDYDSLQQSKWK